MVTRQRWVRGVLVAALLGLAAPLVLVAQQQIYPRGQNVVPVFEGWEQNKDGTFTLVFGYFNRNLEEELDVPIGPDNMLTPAPMDQGQPTHFYPRRNRFQFRVQVPKDFGKKELVWTLTANGKTDTTYGTLLPDYFMDDIVIMNNNGAGGSGGGGNNINGNKAPTLRVDGALSLTVRVGEPVALSAVVTDDGVPKRRVVRNAALPGVPSPAIAGATETTVPAKIGARCCPDSSSGLRLAWFVYRGPTAKVTFDPPQFEHWEDYRDGQNSPYSEGWEPPQVPADNRWTARVTFTAPGTYVLRAQAHDGGLSAEQDLTVVVK